MYSQKGRGGAACDSAPPLTPDLCFPWSPACFFKLGTFTYTLVELIMLLIALYSKPVYFFSF